DLAMRGDGMFAVQAQNGIRYMRAGNFMVDKDRFLVSQEGLKVLGQNGPIQLQEGAFQVTESGEIIQNGQIVNRLQVYSTAGMEKEGEYLYTNESPVPATDFQVIQGAVEHSNVNTVYEMIQMITATRGYETNQKALTAHDDTLGKLVNELAR
ncbi:MAG TPA: flagellar basal body rod C-terminal domain-containing protein, partial [Bacillota bacterium]